MQEFTENDNKDWKSSNHYVCSQRTADVKRLEFLCTSACFIISFPSFAALIFYVYAEAYDLNVGVSSFPKSRIFFGNNISPPLEKCFHFQVLQFYSTT